MTSQRSAKQPDSGEMKLLSRVWLFVIPLTVANQAPLSMAFVEWAALSFSKGTSWPEYHMQVSHMADRHFPLWATRDVHLIFWEVNYFKKQF